MEQSKHITPSLKTRLTSIATTNNQQDFNKRSEQMVIKRTGERIDVNLAKAYLTVLEVDADRMNAGDILLYGRGYLIVTGPAYVSCGLIYFPFSRYAPPRA
jgi:hypothetical protein